jgi:CheY-like chemotaxis protein
MRLLPGKPKMKNHASLAFMPGFVPLRHLSSLMKSTTLSKKTSHQAHSTNRPSRPSCIRRSDARPSSEDSHIGKCILLVDDDPIVRDSLNAVFVSEGYFVIPLENGRQALDFVAKFPVDLVLLDLNMPVKNGWDTFEELTRDHPLIPVIIVTARPYQLFTALGAGAGALLEKPIDIPVLLRTMEKLLAESAEQRLRRLAGKEAEFHYQSAAANH